MDGPALGGRRSGLRGRTVQWFGRPNLTIEGSEVWMSEPADRPPAMAGPSLLLLFI